MVVRISCIKGIVNPSHFYGPVVSTSVAQLTKMCRPVGCRPDGLSPTRLSPRRFVAQMTGDPIVTPVRPSTFEILTWYLGEIGLRVPARWFYFFL